MIRDAVREKVAPILIVGYGYMGKDYVSALLEEGFSYGDIYVVDRDIKKLDACIEKHPGIRCYSSIHDAFLPLSPKTVFNLVNTPSHFNIIEDAYHAGIKHHYIEKPLTLRAEEAERLLSFVGSDDIKMHVGYIINFSPAVGALMEIMGKDNFIVREARGFWGKDRTNNARPTPGDLEDEMTHPLHTILNLIRHNQKIQSMLIQGAVSVTPFANESVQKEACLYDPSFPEIPTATSHVALRIKTDHPYGVYVTVHSSFISFSQKRSIEVNLSPRDNPYRPTHMAEIVFDVKGKDYLRFKEAGSRDITEWEFDGSRKLQDQIHSFLLYAAGQKEDSRLTLLPEAVSMVVLTETILTLDSEEMKEIT